GEKRLVESGGPKFSMDQANTGIPPIDNEWWKCYVMVVSPPRPSSDWWMPVILTTTPLVGAKQSRDSSSALGPRRILAVLMLLLFPALSRALAVPQEQEKTAL